MTIDERVRLGRALRNAGLDSWTSAHHQDCPQVVYLQPSVRDGRVWLRPLFASGQLELAVDVAVATVEAFAESRLAAGADDETFATEDEALALWDRLREAAVESPAEVHA